MALPRPVVAAAVMLLAVCCVATPVNIEGSIGKAIQGKHFSPVNAPFNANMPEAPVDAVMPDKSITLLSSALPGGVSKIAAALASASFSNLKTSNDISPKKLQLSTDRLTTDDMEGNVEGVASVDNISKSVVRPDELMDEPQPIDQHTAAPAPQAEKPRSPPSPPIQADPMPAVKPPPQTQPEPPQVKTVAEDKDDYPSVVIAIPSMRRWQKDHSPAPEHYLYNLVTGIYNQMNQKERNHVTFLLMNVDKEPEKHDELLQLANHPGVKIITKVSSNSAFDYKIKPEMTSNGMAKLADGRQVSVESFEWVSGETRDAPTLLMEASRRASFVLFLEDDVVPTTNVMTKVFATIKEMKAEGKDNFLMLDLYTPAISWGPQTAVNKERYNFECCTQAMLFDSRRVPALVDYELMHPNEPVDDNIRDFVRQNPDNAIYSMVPNPFEHVGRFSSNPEKSTGVTEHKSLSFVP